MSTDRKKFLFFIILYTILSLYTIKFVPLFETTEARYAEIAREMLENGNYIEPYFNGIKHFHKPPFTYWITSIGLKIFGINNFGARFFVVLASIIIFIYLIKIAKFFIKDDEKYFPVYILSTTLLFLVESKIVATDIFLTLWTVAVQYHYFKQIYSTRTIQNSLFIGMFLGLGFITKGPVIFLFTILPYLIMKIFDEKFRKVFTFREIILSVFLFLIIALPWYIVVIIKNPILLEYFLKVQTVDRIATNRFNREKPFYFFFITIFFSTLPYSIMIILKIKQFYLNYKRYIVLIIYTVTPFIILSIAKSKLHSYLTPLFPILSILIFKFYRENFSTIFNKITIIFLSIFPITFISLTLFYEKIKHNPTIILLSLITILFIVLSFNRKDSFHFCYNISLIILLIFNTLYYSSSLFQDRLMGFENLVKTANIIDAERKLELVCYKKDIPSTSFYRNKISIMAFGRERELLFEKDNNYKRFFINSEDEMKKFIENNKAFFLVTKEFLEEFQDKYKIKCEKKDTKQHYTLSLCKNE